MAATKRNAMLIEEAREKIKTTQLINRLQNHALGTVEMSQTQVRATEILLRKRIPDLQAVTLQGDEDGGPVRVADDRDQIIGRILGLASRSGDQETDRRPNTTTVGHA